MSKRKQEQEQEQEQEQHEINNAEWLKRKEEEKGRDQKERDAYQRENFGVVTYERRSEDNP